MRLIPAESKEIDECDSLILIIILINAESKEIDECDGQVLCREIG